MPAKKKTVSSPMHLLQQLSRSLVEHLEKACADAQKETQRLLAKLEKQRSKTRDKLVRARAKLEDAGASGKTKTQAKLRARIDELEDAVALLDARQHETLAYLADLHRDTNESLKLAEGIRRVEEAAAMAVAAPRESAASAGSPDLTQTGSVTTANIDDSPVSGAAPTKPRATRSAMSRAKHAPINSLEGGASVKKAVARKPAGSTQAPASSS